MRVVGLACEGLAGKSNAGTPSLLDPRSWSGATRSLTSRIVCESVCISVQAFWVSRNEIWPFVKRVESGTGAYQYFQVDASELF
jgi:hypothetical protein